MDMFGMPLLVLLALKAIPRDGQFEVGFEICNIAAVCLSFQSGIHSLPRCERTNVACGAKYTQVSGLQTGSTAQARQPRIHTTADHVLLRFVAFQDAPLIFVQEPLEDR